MPSVKPVLVVISAIMVIGVVSVSLLLMRANAPTPVNGVDSTNSANNPSVKPTAKPTAAASVVATETQVNTAGVAPSIAASANANAASVAEAARTGKHSERLSPLMAPSPFNAAAFATNPQAYFDVIEPGRVFQNAEPGLGVPVLEVQGTASREISVGGSCVLSVVTAPKAPVTFTTVDLGTFPNGLTSISVQADDKGIASTTYTASGGVIAAVNILAGSPLASDQVNFHVVVTNPPLTTAATE